MPQQRDSVHGSRKQAFADLYPFQVNKESSVMWRRDRLDGTMGDVEGCECHFLALLQTAISNIVVVMLCRCRLIRYPVYLHRWIQCASARRDRVDEEVYTSFPRSTNHDVPNRQALLRECSFMCEIDAIQCNAGCRSKSRLGKEESVRARKELD
jgi:hypothetical protein